MPTNTIKHKNTKRNENCHQQTKINNSVHKHHNLFFPFLCCLQAKLEKIKNTKKHQQQKPANDIFNHGTLARSGA